MLMEGIIEEIFNHWKRSSANSGRCIDEKKYLFRNPSLQVYRFRRRFGLNYSKLVG
jgi:hypothetical protein